MFNNQLICRIFRSQRPLLIGRAQMNTLDIKEIEEQNALEIEGKDEETLLREAEIERKRNKSGLRPQHRNLVHDTVPYEQTTHWVHDTLKYQRKMFGRYGKDANFDPSLCWYTKKEMSAKLEFEKVAYPYNITELMEKVKLNKQERIDKIAKQQEDIAMKIQKLETWKQELKNKIEKKEADARNAKERKEKLIEEVRRHFGYTVDPRDEKFKEMLDKKEKEQKKAMKEAKKKAKEEKLIKTLTSKPGDSKKLTEDEQEAIKE